MKHRQVRLEKIIERELGRILLTEVKDERLRYVTIFRVDLNNDYSVANIYFSVMGSEDQKQSTARVLEEAKGFIRSSLGKVLEIRKVPELRFKYDKYGEKIEDILQGLKE